MWTGPKCHECAYGPERVSGDILDIDRVKDELGSNSAAVAFRNVAVSTGGALGATDPGELSSSRTQVYDLKNKMKKVDDVDELSLYAKHSEEPIVLEHHDVPEDL